MDKKHRVLIVDDEPDLLETMSFRLISAGYEVLTASNGLDAVKKAEEENPDIIILDIMMPGIDGFETLRKLKEKEKTKKIPAVIFSCGKDEEEWAKKSVGLGAAGYIVKPFESDAMLFTIERFVKRT